MSMCTFQDASSGNLQLILWMNYLLNAKSNHFVAHKVPICKRLSYNILVKIMSPSDTESECRKCAPCSVFWHLDSACCRATSSVSPCSISAVAAAAVSDLPLRPVTACHNSHCHVSRCHAHPPHHTATLINNHSAGPSIMFCLDPFFWDLRICWTDNVLLLFIPFLYFFVF